MRLNIPENLIQSLRRGSLFDVNSLDEVSHEEFDFVRRRLCKDNQIKKYVQKFRKQIKEEGWLIINLNSNDFNLFYSSVLVLSETMFVAPSTGVIDYLDVQLKTDHPFDFSETTRPGYFHTDFFTYKTPPRYVAIMCLEEDPKHPFFGRNQIAHIKDVTNTANDLIEFLRINKVSYVVGNKKEDIQVILGQEEHQAFRLPHAHLIVKDGKKVFDGMHAIDLLNHVCLSCSADIALNAGEVLIVDNYKCVHRRGEASIKFNGGLSDYQSRKLLTIRFF